MRVALAVGGGIAAYKAAELARILQERGAEVEVIMTSAAQQFVQPLTFAALTGRKVITGLWADPGAAADTLLSAVEHIRVAQESDVLAVVPATADLIGKFAHGLADDFVSTLYLAFNGTVVLAPAMNSNMLSHAATQSNLETLRSRGHRIVDPGSGYLACGMTGPGRLAEPSQIADAILGAGKPKGQVRRDFEGETVLITAGPTREPLDPVRYVSNRSSGKMGYALAEASISRGASVVLVSGPVALKEPTGARVIHVETAREMRTAVMDNLADATVIIKAAAVADYQVTNVPEQKMKKTATRLSLELDPTPDILAEVGQKKGDRLLIGFAAETQNLTVEARRKMTTKNCDMVVGNLVNQENTAFEADENEVVLVLSTGEIIPLDRASKRLIADQILDQSLRLRLALHAAGAS